MQPFLVIACTPLLKCTSFKSNADDIKEEHGWIIIFHCKFCNPSPTIMVGFHTLNLSIWEKVNAKSIGTGFLPLGEFEEKAYSSRHNQ